VQNPFSILLLLPVTLLLVIVILTIHRLNDHPQYSGDVRLGQPDKIRAINTTYDKVFQVGCEDPHVAAREPRANAVIVVLARNKELEGVISSMRYFERHFNRWFNYPYVFLNDADFNTTFKEETRKYASGTVEFGKLDPSMWGFPDWADKEVFQEGIRKQGDEAIMYGEMESYHHMCRFYSGFFYKHSLLDKYKWYWRLEPDIKYFCDITYDPFVMMEKNKKVYGFTIAIKELVETVPNIFRYASAFKRSRNIQSKGLWEFFLETKKEKDKKDKDVLKQKAKNKKKGPLFEDIRKTKSDKSALDHIYPFDMESESYNMCHFWSNFEIASLDWFRSAEYNDFFNFMDHSGGFWMERVRIFISPFDPTTLTAW
jgi:mannosyltransferase